METPILLPKIHFTESIQNLPKDTTIFKGLSHSLHPPLNSSLLKSFHQRVLHLALFMLKETVESLRLMRTSFPFKF